jgi:RNA polymerase sigma factor (sigma-70 family)
MGDDELLQAFTEPGSGSEWAFWPLGDRYAGLVYSIAKRRVGDRELAGKVSQNVFAILARKAGQLGARASLAGWLQRVAVLEAAKAMRTEYRRKRKMDEYTEMTVTEEDGAPRWNHVLSLLNEALHKLLDRERDLVLQRYLEGRSYEEIANETGRTKAACAKQSSRVLTKLCGILRRHGVTISATALGAGIAAHYVRTVPAGLAQSLYQSALSASVSASPTLASTFTTIMTSTKFTTAAALISAGAAVPLSFQWANARLDLTSLGNGGSQETIEESHVSVTAKAGDRVSAEGKGTQFTKIGLQLLERELKKLPFPDREIRK